MAPLSFPVPATDGELIQRTLEGDEEAFATLVERYQKRIYRVALAILRNDGDADLVTQDTFVQAYLNLRRFEGRSEFQTWLTRIAINRSRDLLRAPQWLSLSRRDEQDETIPEPVDRSPDAERLTAGTELLAAIDRATAHLTSQQRTIFRLRHLEEMPLDEIANLMNLRPATVRVHLFRAIRKIRKELQEWVPVGYVPAETIE